VVPLARQRQLVPQFLRGAKVEGVLAGTLDVGVGRRQGATAEVGRQLPEVDLAAGREERAAAFTLGDVVAVEILPGQVCGLLLTAWVLQ
jgi:hypothetical protein